MCLTRSFIVSTSNSRTIRTSKRSLETVTAGPAAIRAKDEPAPAAAARGPEIGKPSEGSIIALKYKTMDAAEALHHT